MKTSKLCILLGLSLAVTRPGGVGQAAGKQATEKNPATGFTGGRECAARMTVPPGFEVHCFASEPDVVNPIAMDFDHRGRLWVLECLQYPRKAEKGRKGADRIRIYEDTDGDHHADKVTTFAEGLNLATGLAVGFGGVFVGEAPELIFLEDRDGDDKADARTVLLDGWGTQDTHEMLNSFIWGPDGWLYGCHGVFTHSRVGKPGTPNKDRVPINAGIWRYHPVRQKFEVFAEGTSNPWGYDYDENGSGFLTACVIPHLFHMIPLGLYIRQAGQNFNPYAFGAIRECCDHVHYFGRSSHEGNKDPRRLNVGGGHAHSGCLIYQGGAYPMEWHGRVFMNNLHGARINTDILERKGSSYVGRHGPDFLVANDPNFRAIQLRTGPDGSVYMIDWYDPQICHNTDPAIWDRTHGRIYKVVYKDTKQPIFRDVNELATADLVKLLESKNSWWWRRALLILQERGDTSKIGLLQTLIEQSNVEKDPRDYRVSLRALWALYTLGAVDEPYLSKLLRHRNTWIKSWAIRLLGEVRPRLHEEDIKWLAPAKDKSYDSDSLLQLAVLCQRLKTSGNDPWPIVQGLLRRGCDLEDPMLPVMYWLAVQNPDGKGAEAGRLPELITEAEKEVQTKLADKYRIVSRYILPRVFRKLASVTLMPTPQLLGALRQFSNAEALVPSLDGILEAYRGRRVSEPKEWAETRKAVLARFRDHRAVEARVRQLGIHFGEREAVAAMERAILDSQASEADRIAAIRNLELARRPSSTDPLLQLAIGKHAMELRREALRALAAFESDRIPTAVLGQWSQFPVDFRKDVIVLLAGRRPWAHALLAAIQKGILARNDLQENDVRRILALKDAALTKKVETAWGTLRGQTPQKVEEQLRRLRQQLADLPGDRSAGQAVFEKNCQVCHKLFGKGHEVGPDLSGANRRDPEYLLMNIIDPNRVVGRDYYRAVVLDKSGRVHTGLLAEDSPQRVTLKSENSKLTVIARNEIDEMKIEERSLMPDGLPEAMTETQFRDLIAYIMEEPFLSRGLIAGPFKMALDSASPIESSENPLKTDGVKWKLFELGPTATIDMERLGVLAPPTDSTAFVYFEIKSPEQRTTQLETAADEDVKIWLNGKEIVRRQGAYEPRKVEVSLHEGVNRLLVKVHNIYGPSWLRVRISDSYRSLSIVRPKLP